MGEFLIYLFLNFCFALPIFNAQVDQQKISVEVADTEETRQKGLMNRHEMKPDHGMLFIFDQSRVLNFWMKNTFIPLSIGFFDENCRLVQKLEMTEVASEMEEPKATYSSGKSALMALEMNKDWFKNSQVHKTILTLSGSRPSHWPRCLKPR